MAGSYGYIAPEYGYMMKITEKSDVYSYGVVLLEVLTGKQAIDPSLREGMHLVDWVRETLEKKKDSVEVLDPRLQGRTDQHIQEMLQALGVALLCVNPNPEERPTMKDVAALLKEIKHEFDQDSADSKVELLIKHSPADSKRCNTAATEVAEHDEEAPPYSGSKISDPLMMRSSHMLNSSTTSIRQYGN